MQELHLDLGVAQTEGTIELSHRRNGAVHDNPHWFDTNVDRIQRHTHTNAERVDARLVDNMQEGLQGFVRQEGHDVQDADLQTVGRQDESTNNTGLARINETANEDDKDFRDFQENFGALLHTVLVAIDAFIATVALIFRRWGGDVNVVGVVPVALDRVEDVLEGIMAIFRSDFGIPAKGL